MKRQVNGIMNYSIILTILFFLVGIALIIFPQLDIVSISYSFSILMIALGAFLVLYTMNKLAFMNLFSFGVLQVILGVIILIYPGALVTLLPISLGIWMILKSAIDFRLSLILKEAKVKDWIYVAILSMLAVACGIMLIVKAEIASIELTVIVGIFLTAYSLTAIMDIAIFKENLEKIIKKISNEHK